MDVSAIVNCHREGRLLWRALHSAVVNLNNLPEGKSGELVVVLDNGDKETEDTIHDFFNANPTIDFSKVITEHRDLGLARNTGVERSFGNFCAFLDADDVWGPQWLARALAFMEKSSVPSDVAHPQLIVNFELDQLWWQHEDSRGPGFDPSVFFMTNHWTAHNFTRRDFLLLNPYKSVGDGFGFEDWEWNTRTLAAGSAHVVVPETVHFIRKSFGSMSQKHANQGRVVRPNAFFDKRMEVTPIKLPPTTLGQWLVDEWKGAHQSEPELWPQARELSGRPHYTPPRAPGVYNVYHRIRATIPKNATHLVLFAGYGGGADLRVTKYADAIIKAGGVPVLVATDQRSNVEKAVEAHEALNSLSLPDQTRVMQRLMLQFDGVIHVVNSRSAWAALTLTDAFKGKPIFASLYAFEHLKEPGRLGGYAANGSFGQSMDKIKAIITDNLGMPVDLKNVFGWNDTVVAFTPTTPTEFSPPKKIERLMRFLWAGTADSNKNLALVIDIALAAMAAHEPFLFDVVGDSCDYFGFDALTKLRKLPNVTVNTKPFQSWAELKPEKYDALIYTSKHEGYPNIVLEAMSHGLVVASTRAGGVGFEEEGFPGVIVNQAETPSQWCTHLKNLVLNKEQHNPREWLRKHRSFDGFYSSLKSSGYFGSLVTADSSPST